jgi:potassium-transporting ATPase KdpC subunit
MRRQVYPALVLFLFMTVLTGVVYPLAMTGIAQLVFPERANGSLVEHDGRIVGSRLLGQSFSDDRYFHPRPSAAGTGYDGAASSPSNLGPTNDALLSAVEERVHEYRTRNGLPDDTVVPVDAVTSSGSGLDPHISPENARLQARRVARARGRPLERVLELVGEHTEGRALGFLGEPGVNVLELNLALDSEGP